MNDGPPPGTAGTRLLDLAREQELAGRPAEAYDTLLSAARESTGSTETSCEALADALVEASRRHRRSGRYGAARPEPGRAGTGAAEPADRDVHLLLLSRLGESLRLLGRYRDSETMLRNALALAEEVFGPGSLAVGRVCNSLGVLRKYTGRFDESERAYRRALEIVEANAGAAHPLLADIHHNLGGLNHARGTHAQGEPLARHGLELRQRTCRPDHPDVAADKAALAALLHALGRMGEAEGLLRDALAVFEREFGPEHYEVASALNNLAAIRYAKGELEAAESAYLKVLAIKERLLGRAHPELAVALNNLAMTVWKRGRPQEAALLLRRAVDLLGDEVEREQPVRLACVRNLGSCLRAAGAVGTAGGGEGDRASRRTTTGETP
ncbi:tetratricopeptide repeat protein [Planomonospora parontospora]|uniref:tetratricopeptide repeat protein n=1 Tax=Planomonospora parontospora TaxID=58119 RepID=UPI001670E427|nr:tetratricopeptide repeat protein [Planomonospora parontospora]GGL29251.1 hypothetical protein GCM10014719_33410 [Planomonospora parontospora subsp. antibiotica]GII19742.1 hypothetical protein Ppa05_64680 [Planomonospora parontospora subsp. antibiotica]